MNYIFAIFNNIFFHRLWAIFDPELIMRIFVINYIFAMFGRKPWTITHTFDQFLATFDPSLILPIFGINYIVGVFQQKTMDYNPSF